ncbi:MAG: thioredoxin family protein [Chitinophagales bacterium]
MALTPSNMLPLGTLAPPFHLQDAITGNCISLDDVKGSKGLVVYFICNHCPYVIHVNQTLVAVAKKFQSRGMGFVAISSNDIERYPQDRPELMKEVALREGYCFPYLYDASQDVAKAYDAACTPDIYLFDASLKLAYRGQLDDSRPGNGKQSNGSDIIKALEAVLAGKPPDLLQRPSAGCNIKWKS